MPFLTGRSLSIRAWQIRSKTRQKSRFRFGPFFQFWSVRDPEDDSSAGGQKSTNGWKML